MGLVDATGLGLVSASALPGLIGAYDHASRRPLTQWQMVMRQEGPLFPRLAFDEYLHHYRPGGPMGPMRESPYRDWPPAREGWHR